VDGAPAAFHLGFVSEGDLLWYKPSFNPALARYSPGEVLLRELLLYAGEHRLSGLDFTRGDEAFKRRFSDMERCTKSFRFYSDRSEALRIRSRDFVRNQLRALARTGAGSALHRWLHPVRD
jgi:CelD/BcsL family acetyltransferase involved in cellulose biosynthesis